MRVRVCTLDWPGHDAPVTVTVHGQVWADGAQLATDNPNDPCLVWLLGERLVDLERRGWLDPARGLEHLLAVLLERHRGGTYFWLEDADGPEPAPGPVPRHFLVS